MAYFEKRYLLMRFFGEVGHGSELLKRPSSHTGKHPINVQQYGS